MAVDRVTRPHVDDLVERLDLQVRERVRREGVDPQREALVVRRIAEDVVRLDRLISDISDASRVDAELSRTATERMLPFVLRCTAASVPTVSLKVPSDGRRTSLPSRSSLASTSAKSCNTCLAVPRLSPP